MGFSLGGSYGSTNSSSKSSSNTTPTYSADQSGLQAVLMQAFQSIVPAATGGSLTPDVQAMETAGADQINKSYSTLGDRMSKFLAGRGFGKSGAVGSNALNTELARQGDLASNRANAAKLQFDQSNSWLKDALAAAFTNPGETAAATGAGNSSGWNVGAGVGGKF